MDCIKSDILEKIQGIKIRLQTDSHSSYTGVIKETDCMGVLFLPENKKDFDDAYVLYSDMRKVMIEK